MTRRRRLSGVGAADAADPAELWRASLLAPVVARGIMLAAFGAFCVVAFVFVVYAETPVLECVQAAVYLGLIFALQVYFGRPQTQVSVPVSYAVLLAQAALILVPLTQFGSSWGGMPVLLAANAVVVLPRRIGWLLLGFVVGVLVLTQCLAGATVGDLSEVLVAGVLGALEFYGLTRLARLITVVHAARAELGEAAVARERLRFAGDLHDLLGLSLSTVGPKAVAAQEAMADEPRRAQGELGEILTIARHALADVRLVACGYREISLNEKSRTVAKVEGIDGGLGRTTPPRGGNRLRGPGHGADVDPVRAQADETLQESSRLTNWLTRTVFIGFVVTVVFSGWRAGHDTPTLLVIAGFAVASLVVQLFYVSRVDRHVRPSMSHLVLALQAVLVYAPLVWLGPAWSSVPGFLAGSALLLLRPVAGWFVFVAVLVSVPVAKAANLVHPLLVVNVAASTLITGLVVYGLTWMSLAVYQLRAARFELARIAVAEERMRFARDLHDLLGLSLSAITLKTELAQRLMAADQNRARQELREIVDISRLALADVRLVANGYRELSLNEESRSAESVLVAAEVDVRLEMNYGELSPEVRTVLATVLREGVTNVLRHSLKGARCEITVRQVDRMVTMEIVNNGVAGRPGLSPGGSGLRNLSARVERVGGQLTAGLSPDGTFRLSARLPAQPVGPGATSSVAS